MKPNQTTCELDESGGKKRCKTKKRVKTLPNSTVTLKPRLLSFLDSSMSYSSPGWRLLTPEALPFKFSMMFSCKQRIGHYSELSQAWTCRKKSRWVSRLTKQADTVKKHTRNIMQQTVAMQPFIDSVNAMTGKCYKEQAVSCAKHQVICNACV